MIILRLAACANIFIHSSQGIIAAIRKAGGKFINYDRRRNIVSYIGDKKAFVKTSQAIRDKINKNEDDDGNEVDVPFPFDSSNYFELDQELPQKWYTDYSCSQLLKSINSSNAVTAGDTPQNERVALVQNHQEVPAYTSTTVKSSPFHQEHVTRARDADQYLPLPVRQSSDSSHDSIVSFLDGCFEEDVDGVFNALIRNGNQCISDDE